MIRSIRFRRRSATEERLDSCSIRQPQTRERACNSTFHYAIALLKRTKSGRCLNIARRRCVCSSRKTRSGSKSATRSLRAAEPGTRRSRSCWRGTRSSVARCRIEEIFSRRIDEHVGPAGAARSGTVRIHAGYGTRVVTSVDSDSDRAAPAGPTVRRCAERIFLRFGIED